MHLVCARRDLVKEWARASLEDRSTSSRGRIERGSLCDIFKCRPLRLLTIGHSVNRRRRRFRRRTQEPQTLPLHVIVFILCNRKTGNRGNNTLRAHRGRPDSPRLLLFIQLNHECITIPDPKLFYSRMERLDVSSEVVRAEKSAMRKNNV